jgi:hypothetical protein
MPKSWDAGLRCSICGKPVRRGTGFYVYPVGGKPWARHVGECPK